MTDETREALAAYAHHAWSGWMLYLFGHSYDNPDGSVTIPARWAKRWKRQASTEYNDLPESEKKSDRKEAIRMMVIMQRTKGD